MGFSINFERDTTIHTKAHCVHIVLKQETRVLPAAGPVELVYGLGVGPMHLLRSDAGWRHCTPASLAIASVTVFSTPRKATIGKNKQTNRKSHPLQCLKVKRRLQSRAGILFRRQAGKPLFPANCIMVDGSSSRKCVQRTEICSRLFIMQNSCLKKRPGTRVKSILPSFFFFFFV